MQKERKDKHFIKQPIYEGGPKALKAFISKNLRYPKEALAEQIEGTVVIRYTINYKGKVVASKIVSPLSHGCNEEAERLVRLLKFEVPKNRGVKATFHKTLSIHFRLPQTPVTPPQAPNKAITQIQYNYTSSSTEEKAPSSSGGYQYTITINKS